MVLDTSVDWYFRRLPWKTESATMPTQQEDLLLCVSGPGVDKELGWTDGVISSSHLYATRLLLSDSTVRSISISS
jgi:hypothetical protein